jgi:hypothetical protein
MNGIVNKCSKKLYEKYLDSHLPKHTANKMTDLLTSIIMEE